MQRKIDIKALIIYYQFKNKIINIYTKYPNQTCVIHENKA